ncbi:MAG: hypothetical protein JXR72_04330 [Proteobacteria bacterium]|nr:hypothetical protein [Pseudomonadota bacterium]
MKNLKILVILAVLAGSLAWTASPAVAARGCEGVGNETLLEGFEFPQMPGQKIHVSLAVQYDLYPTVTMYAMMKVTLLAENRVGVFTGVIPTTAYYGYFLEQFVDIGLFIQDRVLPIMLECGEDCPQLCQPDKYLPEGIDDCSLLPSYFSLKKITDLIEEGGFNIGGDCCDFPAMFVDFLIGVVGP